LRTILPSLLLLITLLTGLICPHSATAQPYYFRHYQVENGLSNNTVNCSAQDKNGFLWFGTKEGLNRFDGYRFKLFHLEKERGQAFNTDNIYCLTTDKNGTLWVGSARGLYRFDEEQEKLVRVLDSLIEVNSIVMDKNGQLWFLSWNTLCRYNFQTGKLKMFPPEKYFYATSVCLSEEGDIWICSTRGTIHKFLAASESFSTYNVFSHSPPPSSTWLQKIYPAGKGSLFVGSSVQGIKQFDIATSTYKDLLTFNPDKTTIFVRDIIKYSENEYWFATESGIFILDKSNQQFTNLKKKFLDPYSLSDNAVYTLCRDKEGGVWAGTFFGGVNYYPKQYSSFQKFYPDNSDSSISGSAVREICEDRNHDIWIGTEDAGLNKLDPATGSITQYKPTGRKTDIAYSNIHGLLATENDLWVGTFEHGLDVLDIRTGKVKKLYTAGPGPHELKSNFVLTIIRSKSGDIYLGSSNGLYRYNKKNDNFDRPGNLPEPVFVAGVMEDHQQTIWVATHGLGVYYFNPHTGEQGNFRNNPNDSNSLTINTTNAICEDSNNNIWISTEGGGICVLDSSRKKFSYYSTKNGLPSNYVFKVIEDNKKTFWAGTSKGLVNLDPEKHSATVYTKANGLLYDQFNYSSGFKDSSGNLYFGSIKGMIVFKPDEFFQSRFIPPIYITGFQVQNKELTISKDSSPLKKSIVYTDEITLPYDKSSFSIDFAALSYTAPEMTEYSYIMAGLDKEWTNIQSNRKVYFTNLAPGHYTFKFRAATNNVWTRNEKTLSIEILPPFWATKWAYLIYFIAGLAALYYIVINYHKRTQIKKEKEIYEAKIDFFTNVAHEIRTPLTLIKGPLEFLAEKKDQVPEIRDDVNTIERNTNRLIALVTQILDFRKTEIKGFSLDFAKVDISQLLTESVEGFGSLAKNKSLRMNLELPENDVIAYADEEALIKIFSNLLSNAVKYAREKISIRLSPIKKEDESLTLEVTNDGDPIPAEMKEKIFEPFFRLKQQHKHKGTGIGLSLARSLAELHNGSLYLDDTREDKLNTFILSLPLKPAAGEVTKLKKNKPTLNL